MYEIPKIEMPSVQVRRFTAAEVKIMSDEDLLKILSGENLAHGMLPAPTQQLISAELLSRSLARASKPHWSIVPSFALLIVSVILSIIAIALPFYLQ